MLLDLTMVLVRIALMLLVVLQVIPILIWWERKVSAYIQSRRGPAYASAGPLRLFGLVHTLTDVVKLIGKEDITPANANKPFHYIAPAIAMFVALLTFAVVPYSGSVVIAGREFPLQAASLNAGILYILAIASLGVYGILLAAWSSNNKYTLLGGLRSSSQLVSYELVMSLALVGALMVYGSLELGKAVSYQSGPFWHWGAVVQPVAALLFIVCAFAETNRNPFDLPEGESEIVAGYHVEYSSLRFALFFMAEYANMIVASGVIATLFFGGYEIPFLPTETLRANAGPILRIVLLAIAAGGTVAGLFFGYLFFQGNERGPRDPDAAALAVLFGFGPAVTAGAVLALSGGGHFEFGPTGASLVAAVFQFACFMAKLLFFAFLFIWVRWTLPRFRYDQLMRLGWKYMLPLALLNVLITALLLERAGK